MLNIQTTDNNTMKQMQDKRAGGLITQEVRFLLSNGLKRGRSQAGICKPRFNTEKEQLCLNVSSSSRKPDFSGVSVRIGRFRQPTVLRGEQVHHSRASSAADHRNLKAWRRRWVSSLITKFDAGFHLYKAVTLQKRWTSLISLPADPAIQCHSCLY